LIGVFIWYWVHHQDRYLQIIVPWMAAVVAATMILVWRTGVLNRVLLGALVALQIVWGSDVYFASRHGMHGDQSVLPVIINLFGAGLKGNYIDRLKWGDQNLYAIGRTLRPGDKVLVHESHRSFGLMRPGVMDWLGWQGGLSYGRAASACALYAQLSSYGVTHLLWSKEFSRGYDSVAGDLKFFWFTRYVAVDPSLTGDLSVARMPVRCEERHHFPEWVAFLACDGTYEPGLYRLDTMTVSAVGSHAACDYPAPVEPLPQRLPTAWMNRATFVVHDPSCAKIPFRVDPARFELLAKRNHLSLYTTRGVP
jgi:hypothetical protein